MDHFTIPNEKIVKLELADFPICALSSDEPKIVVGFDDFFSTFDISRECAWLCIERSML